MHGFLSFHFDLWCRYLYFSHLSRFYFGEDVIVRDNEKLVRVGFAKSIQCSLKSHVFLPS